LKNLLLSVVLGVLVPGISSASDDAGTEKLNLVVEACHLNIGKIGGRENGKGDPRLVIYKNKVPAYDSKIKHKDATGPDFTFNDAISMEIKKGDSVKIVLSDVDVIRDDVLISQESSDLNSIKQMLNGKHEKEGSWYQCKLQKYAQGKYLVQLISSSMARDDVDATIPKAPVIGKELDVPDHLVCVWQNGKEIFTTGKAGEDCGPLKKWDRQSFEIQWKPGDKLEVGFYERDPMQNDKIFLVTDSTDNSLGLFTGTLAGGKSNSSNVIFSITDLK